MNRFGPPQEQRQVKVLVLARSDLARQRRPEVVRGGDRSFQVDPRADGDAVHDRIDGRRMRDLHPPGVRRRRALPAIARRPRRCLNPDRARRRRSSARTSRRRRCCPPRHRGASARPDCRAGRSAGWAGCCARRRAFRRRTPRREPPGWRRPRSVRIPWRMDARGSPANDSAGSSGPKRHGRNLPGTAARLRGRAKPRRDLGRELGGLEHAVARG